MSDPLSVLREHFISKTTMKYDDNNIVIGDLKFPRSTLTAYKQDRGRGDPYTLEALFFLLQNPHLAGAAKTRAYNDECKKKNFSRVLLVDQKDVLNYLTGKTETSQYLVSIDELATISAQPERAKDAVAKPEVEKKRKHEEPKMDMTDETIRAAKKQLAEMMEARPLSQLLGKTPAEMRQIASSDNIEQTKNAYILGDLPVTRAIREKERLLCHRGNALHSKSAHSNFAHLLNLVRGAFGSQQDRSGASKPVSVPGQPQRRDRYNVEAKDAYKAAGIDAVLLSADKGGSLLTSEPSKRSENADKGGGAEPRQGIPIIIVPQAQTSLINVWNIKELLEKATFRTREERKAEGAKKEDKVTIVHLEDGWNARYKIVTDPTTMMKRDDWLRVVACFVQGPEWQFKGWDLSAFDGKLVNFFNRVSAFHVEYEKEPRHPNILLWNVKVMSVHKTKRHMDEKVMNNFWETLKKYRRLAVQRKNIGAAAKTH